MIFYECCLAFLYLLTGALAQGNSLWDWLGMMPVEDVSLKSPRNANWYRNFKDMDMEKLRADPLTTFVSNVSIPSSIIEADYTISAILAGSSDQDIYILRRRASTIGLEDWGKFGGFNNGDYDRRTEGSIPVDCVIQYNLTNSTVISSYGSNVFYYPSFMTKDPEGSFWFTDTAMQQVLQMNAGDTSPNQTLGTEFAQGNTESRFCGPTAVAVTERHIYVADGLCNNRIVMYSRDLKYISQFGASADEYIGNLNLNGQSIFTRYQQDSSVLPVQYLNKPVALAVDASTDRLFIAENGYSRVLVWKAGETDESRFGTGLRAIFHERMEKFTAIVIHPTNHKLFAANAANRGPHFHRGFTFNANDASFEGSWVQTEPSDPEDDRGFYHPLAMTASESGNKIYVVDLKDDKYVVYTFNHSTPSRNRRHIFSKFNPDKGDNSYLNSNSMYRYTRSQNKGNVFQQLPSTAGYNYRRSDRIQSAKDLFQHILESAGLRPSHRYMKL